MREIVLAKSKGVVRVDDDDYERLVVHRWRLCKGYAITGKHIRMHRMIIEVGEGEEVDHVDFDTLNNQRSNLRVATRSQNNYHTRSRKGSSSKYKGVSWDGLSRKWRAQIRTSSGVKYIGVFDKEDDAAVAYDTYAMKEHGEFAVLNMKQ